MKNIINELYDLNIFHLTEIGIENSEYKSMLDRLIKLETELLKTYPDCKEMLEEFQTANGDLHSFVNRNEFRKGFIAGAQVMIEILTSIK